MSENQSSMIISFLDSPLLPAATNDTKGDNEIQVKHTRSRKREDGIGDSGSLFMVNKRFDSDRIILSY
jgi:hypothetical protein